MCTDIQITFLMLLIIIENSLEIFKFPLALPQWEQIALS